MDMFVLVLISLFAVILLVGSLAGGMMEMDRLREMDERKARNKERQKLALRRHYGE